jgi:hypothetical protein
MRNINKRLLIGVLIFTLLTGVFIFIQKAPNLLYKEEKALVGLNKAAINQLVIVDEKERITVTKKNNRWLIGDFPADQERIEKIIEVSLGLKKKEAVSRNKNKYTDFEVTGKRKIELGKDILYIGKTYAFGRSYFRVEGDSNVYVADEDLSNLLYPKDFRDLKLYFISDENKVDRVEISWEGEKSSLIKKDGKWLTSANKTAKKDRVDFLINDIKTLKGDDVFEKKKIDLSSYSVDLSLMVSEAGKDRKGFFYKKNEEKYYFYQEGANYVYQIPATYVASLKKEEKDLVE